MNTAPYGGEPALHIVVLAVMNCPSGPFRSKFLLSTLQRWNPFSFHCVPGVASGHGEESGVEWRGWTSASSLDLDGLDAFVAACLDSVTFQA